MNTKRLRWSLLAVMFTFGWVVTYANGIGQGFALMVVVTASVMYGMALEAKEADRG